MGETRTQSERDEWWGEGGITFEDLVRWIDGEVLAAVVCGGISGGVSHGRFVSELQIRARERETAKESDSDYGEEELGLKDPTRIGGLKRQRTFTYPAYNSILL